MTAQKCTTDSWHVNRRRVAFKRQHCTYKYNLLEKWHRHHHKKKLRSNTNTYILGHLDHQIIGSKLPSNRQVSSVFLSNMRELKLSYRDSARLAIEEAIIFWEKARIETNAKWYSIRKLEEYYNT